MINETEWLYVAERKYLEPATRTGPAPNELMPPIILVFDKPQSESDVVDAGGLAGEDPAAQYARPALRRARA